MIRSSQKSPDQIAVVALCNRYALRQEWLPHCAGTWSSRLLAGQPRYLVSDGSLNAEELERFQTLTGFSSRENEEVASELQGVLKRYPAMALMREKCVFYRRIIDFSLLFKDFTHILNVDTDIMVRSAITLPTVLPSFAFCVDDCPGYSCAASVVFRRKIVTGLNAGFLLFKPQEILGNLDFIEDVTRKFIQRGKTHWWAEQTLWALIAGSVAKSVAVFSSESVAIVSGLRKRSLADIRQHRTRYFAKTTQIVDSDEVEQVVGDAQGRRAL